MLLKMKSYIKIIISFFAIFLFTGCYEGDIYLKNKSHNMLVLDLSHLTTKTFKFHEQMFMVDGNRSGTSKKIASNIYEANINNTIFGIWDKNTQTLSLKGLKPNTHYSIQALNSNKLEVETLPLLSGEIYWKTYTGEYLIQSSGQIGVSINSLNSNQEPEYINNENNQASEQVDVSIVSLNSNPESEYINNNENNIPTKINMLYNGSFALLKIQIDETNFKYLGIDDNGTLTIINNNEYNISNQFEYIENFENVVLFKSKKTGTYLVKDGNLIKASTTNSGNNENAKFQLDHIKKSTSKISIKSILSGKYLDYDANNDKHHAIKDQSNGEYTVNDFGLFKHIFHNGKYLTTRSDNKHFYYADDNLSDYRLIRFEIEQHQDGTESLINHYSKKRVSLADDSSTIALGNFNVNPFLLYAANTNGEDDEAENHEKFDIEHQLLSSQSVRIVVKNGKVLQPSKGSTGEIWATLENNVDENYYPTILEDYGAYKLLRDKTTNKYIGTCGGTTSMYYYGESVTYQVNFHDINDEPNCIAKFNFIDVNGTNRKKVHVNTKYVNAYWFYFKKFEEINFIDKSTSETDAFPGDDRLFDIQYQPIEKNISLQVASTEKFYNGKYPSNSPVFNNMILQDHGTFVTFKHHSFPGKYLKVIPHFANNYKMEWEGTELNQYTKFTMIEQDDGTVAFKSFYEDRYLQGSSYWGDDRLTVQDTTLDNKAKFWVLKTPTIQKVAIQYNRNKLCFDKNDGSANNPSRVYIKSDCMTQNITMEDYGSFVTFKIDVYNAYITALNDSVDSQVWIKKNDTTIRDVAKFKIEPQGNGIVAIKALVNNKYVSEYNVGSGWNGLRLHATNSVVDEYSKFWIITAPKKHTISLQANNNKFIEFAASDTNFYASNNSPLENITLIDRGSFVSLKSKNNNKYLKVFSGYGNQISAGTDNFLDINSRFIIENLDDGRVAIKSVGFNQYVAIKSNSWGDNRLTAGTVNIEDKSKFWIVSADSSYTRHATDTLTQNIVNYLSGKEFSDISSVIVRDKDYNIVTGRYNSSTGIITLNDDDELLHIEVTTKDNEIFKIKLYRSFGYPLASFKIKNSADANCKQIEKNGNTYSLVNKICSDSDDWYYGYSGWLYQDIEDKLVCASQNGENLDDATFSECNYENANEIFSTTKQWIINPNGNDDFIVKSNTHFDYNTSYDDPYTFVNLEQFAGSLKSNFDLSPLITYATYEGSEDEIEVTKVSPIDFWSNSNSLFRLKDQTKPWKLDMSYFPFNYEFKSLDFIIPFTIDDYHTKAAANENINAEFNVAEYFKFKVYRTDDSHSKKVLRIEVKLDCSNVQIPEYCVPDEGSKEMILSTDILETDHHYLDEFGIIMFRYNKDANSLALNLGTRNYQNNTLTKGKRALVISRAAIGDESFYKLANSIRLIGASQEQTIASNVDLIFNSSTIKSDIEKPVQQNPIRQKRSLWTWFAVALIAVGTVALTVVTAGAGLAIIGGAGAAVATYGGTAVIIAATSGTAIGMGASFIHMDNNPVAIEKKINIQTTLTSKDKAVLYNIDDDFSINIDQYDTSSSNIDTKNNISFSSDGIIESNINSFFGKQNIQIVCAINPDALSSYRYKCFSNKIVVEWNSTAQTISSSITIGKNFLFNTIGNLDPDGIVIEAKYIYGSKNYIVKYKLHLADDLNSLNKDVSLLSTNGSSMHNILLSRKEVHTENFRTSLNDLNILQLTQEHSDYSITKGGIACLPLLDKTYSGYELIDNHQGHNYICSALADKVTNLRLSKNSFNVLSERSTNGKYILLTVNSSNIEHIFINADISIDDKNYTITQKVGKESDLEDNSSMKNFYKYRIARNGFNDISSLIDVDLSFTGDYYWDESTPKPRVPFECYEDLTSNKLVCKGESSISGKTLVLKNNATQVGSHTIGTGLMSFTIPDGALLSNLVISVQDGNTVQYSSSADAFMNTVKATVIKEDANNNPSSIYDFYRDTEDKEDDATDKILLTNSELGLFHIREMNSSKQISFHDAIGCVPNRKDLYIPDLTEDSNGNISPNNLFVYKDEYNTLCLIFGDNGSSGFSDFSLKTKDNISYETSSNGKMIWINRTEEDDDIFLTAKVTRGTSTYKVTLKPRHVEANASVELDDFYNTKSEREQGLLYVPSLMSVAMFPTSKRVPGMKILSHKNMVLMKISATLLLKET